MLLPDVDGLGAATGDVDAVAPFALDVGVSTALPLLKRDEPATKKLRNYSNCHFFSQTMQNFVKMHGNQKIIQQTCCCSSTYWRQHQPPGRSKRFVIAARVFGTRV